MKQLNYVKVAEAILSRRLEVVDSIAGIDYLHDGAEGLIIAVDVKNELAAETSFFETDDFFPHMVNGKEVISDYQIVNDNGRLCCYFESEAAGRGKIYER